MLKSLSWITEAGSVANLLIGVPASVQLLAYDPYNTTATLSYSLIGGSLPDGMTLDNTGLLSGSPIYSVSSQSTTITYDFTVRVVTNTAGVTPSDRRFTVILSNIVNGDFSWITPAGDLGHIPSSEFYKLRIQAESISNSSITYTHLSGDLPTGMQLLPKDIYFNNTIQTANAQSTISNTLTFSAATALSIPVGSVVTGPYIPANTKVVSVNPLNKTVTLSANTIQPVPTLTGINFNGLQSAGGTLQGVPVFLNLSNVASSPDISQTYRFTVRATNGLGRIDDRSFSLTVTDVFGPTITPASTYLGSYFDGKYYSQQLNVAELNPSVNIQWSIVKGSLPPGLTLTNTGAIQGYIEPIELIGQYGPGGYDGYVSGATVAASSIVNGEQYVIQFPGSTDFTLIGASTNEVGQIFTATGPATGTGTAAIYHAGIYSAVQEYDFGPYDFPQLSQSAAYSFTVQAFDGANYDTQDYILDVVSRGNFTADSTILINNTFITADAGNVYYPVLLNTDTTITTGRQNSFYAFKLDGYDFQGDHVTYNAANEAGTFDALLPGIDGGFDYNIPADSVQVPFDSDITTGTSVLPGLRLDDQTGWIYGNITPQSESYKEYRFGIYVSKTHDTFIANSTPVYFTLPVLGDVNNKITWVTNSKLGSIINGSVSDLNVVAVSDVNPNITYSLYDSKNVSSRLPQGLTLLPSGEISGRVTFEAFTIDNYTTTFDNGTMSLDRTYKFTVLAETNNGSGTISSTREFTLTLVINDIGPYENLYLKAMPPANQKAIYANAINDVNIFDPALIYRPTDPWYGIRKDLEMLFLPGLNPDTLDNYRTAITKNHWTKNYTFGDIKTAAVLDPETYERKYDVVYIELLDPEENVSGVGPALELDLSGVITNPYIDANGNSFDIVYPNTSDNMISRLANGVGYADQSSLPDWMTSNQPDTTNANKFLPPIGYTKAAVIAYTKPTAGETIAYRLRQQTSQYNFDNIEFTVDRYNIDDYYTQFFDSATKKFIGGVETTFDSTQKSVGDITATVNYVLNVSFSEINGRPVSYINSNGGFDGVNDFRDGQTLVFGKQEKFPRVAPYDGWIDYTDAWIGDNVTTSTIEGYDQDQMGVYDAYTLIPGYLEKLGGGSTVNQRGGVWKINIVNSIVFLTFVKEININDRVRVLNGKTYSSAVVYYNPILAGGETVPSYSVYQVDPSRLSKPTTFNAGTTRFFSNRDQYYTPESQDKYLKFPQHGVF
jgi:hypothetical protein